MKFLLAGGLLLLLLTFGCVTGTNLEQTNNDTGTGLTDDHMMTDDGTSPDAMMEHDDAMTDDAMTHDDTMMEDTNDSMMEHDDTMMDDSNDSMMEHDGAIVKGVEYVPFTQEAYDLAKSEGKTIFLEFYANWCPICKAQAPALEEGLTSLSSNKLVAFRVNYKDSDTDASEEALAAKYNITYQHTHVVVNSNEEVQLKSLEDWTTQDVIDKVGAFA